MAQTKWSDYSAARDAMLARTSTPLAPWTCVATDKKRKARIAVLRHLLRQIAPAAIAAEAKDPDPDVLFAFDIAAATDGRLAL